MLIPQRGRGFTKTWIRPDCKWSLISASDKKRGPNTRGNARVFFRLLAVQGSTNRNTKGSHALRDVAGVTMTMISLSLEFKTPIHYRILRATCIAIFYRHKLQQKLPSVTDITLRERKRERLNSKVALKFRLLRSQKVGLRKHLTLILAV